ncbi:hypothetical protein [Paenibacillus abyssi]|uniref:Uncharacterized protein n=1 Tax=Paenibacillus abyssi TaxID=1340531 RepID=A0A917CY79_9BACL|nr:hypothetical protein [Paenibacillus abyssi]GGG03223.1 hypothetical protein GCM10010916_20390 [Paenibacillus abyssi]
MRAVVAIIVVGSAFFLWQGRMLIRQKRKKEWIVFTVSLLIAMALYISVGLHLSIPSPTEMIGNWLEPFIKPIVKWTEGGY